MRTKLIPITPDAIERVFPGPLVMVSLPGRVHDVAFHAIDRDAKRIHVRGVDSTMIYTFDFDGVRRIGKYGYPNRRTLQFCVPVPAPTAADIKPGMRVRFVCGGDLRTVVRQRLNRSDDRWLMVGDDGEVHNWTDRIDEVVVWFDRRRPMYEVVE